MACCLYGGDMAAKKNLGELLIKENLIDMSQLESAKKHQAESGGNLTGALVNLGYVNEKDLAQFLGQQYELPHIDLENFECDPEAIKMLSSQVCEKHMVIPISKAGKTLVVAFADPSNIFVKDDLALLTRCKIEAVVASEVAIKQAIEKYYGVKNQFANFSSDLEDEADFNISEDDVEVVGDVDDESDSLIKFVNAMLAEAIKSRASDIHIEPYEKRFRVRFRIDGRLTQKTQPPQGAAASIVSRLKIMSKMDIAEKRRPQDGRLKVRVHGGADVDFRVSSIPTMFGEKMVLRILDKSNLQVDMTQLGFEKDQLETLQESIHLPQGMVLITGPTGSGKTTTIYSCLAELNKPEVNICTAEDPIEFNLDGINQVQVNPEIDFTFADALKSFLRQDPDIVMVGEIRDLDTANVAYKAASTGHLVVSTLHTNDAASTVSRLLDMGVANFLVAESTTLVVAQRLMRKNCQKCLTDTKVEPNVLIKLGVPEDQLHEYNNLKKGEGCHFCGQTGLSGRIAIHEILKMTAEVKDAIFKGASPLQLKRQGIKSGMQTLRMSALNKLKRGITTVEEVLNSSVSDDI